MRNNNCSSEAILQLYHVSHCIVDGPSFMIHLLSMYSLSLISQIEMIFKNIFSFKSNCDYQIKKNSFDNDNLLSLWKVWYQKLSKINYKGP